MTAQPPDLPFPHGRNLAPTVFVALLLFATVRFFVTGLFRLGVPAYVAGAACLALTAGLARLPRRGNTFALSWLGGCTVWVGFLYWMMGKFAEGLQHIG